jgi:glucosamine 6-phosphate synthetase-like amidotransferase/phosphosugar isomerase protein
MCGIFGFALKNPVSMSEVWRTLEKLEVHRYPQELRPVGGYGAGIAVLESDGSIVLEKVGKVSDSPARSLSEIVKGKVTKASVLVGHVRMPSPEFMDTAKFKETAQPYVVQHDPQLTIVSVHNGKLENYVELRAKLGEAHVFESEKVGLIDSEVIPHYFEEILNEKENVHEALHAFFDALQGSNAIGILQVEEEKTYLHFIHKGKTRGLTVWTNRQNEVVFCSRKEPVMDQFARILSEGKFEEELSIPYATDRNLQASFALKLI